MSSAPLSTVLAALLVLAGCQGVAPGPETPTLTPAAVPTDVLTERPPRTLAPGVTGDGVEDPPELAAAHAEALAGTSVTYHATYTERAPDGSVRARTVTTVRFGAGDRYHYVRTDHGPNGTTRRVERWSNGERVQELVVADGTTRRVLRGADGEPLPPAAALPVERGAPRGIVQVFQAVATTVIGREVRNGTAFYLVASTGLRTPNPSALRDASLLARIDERGVVHRHRLSYVTDRGDDSGWVRVNGTVRYTDVGSTTVERPVWAEERD